MSWWKPRAATTLSWQWQLGSTLDVERCRCRRTCDGLAAFTRAGKPVLQVEYTAGIVSILKTVALDAWRQTC